MARLYLISCSSGDIEFSRALRSIHQHSPRRLPGVGLIYQVADHEVCIIAEGRPVNFYREDSESLPACVADLISGQLLLAAVVGIKHRLPNEIHRIDRSFFVGRGGDGYSLSELWAEQYAFQLPRAFAGGQPAIGPHPNEGVLAQAALEEVL